jgi:hypothetical protein
MRAFNVLFAANLSLSSFILFPLAFRTVKEWFRDGYVKSASNSSSSFLLIFKLQSPLQYLRPESESEDRKQFPLKFKARKDVQIEISSTCEMDCDGKESVVSFGRSPS